MDKWNSLSQAHKAEVMKLAVSNGIYNLDDIRQVYNEYADGGNLYEGTTMPTQKMKTYKPYYDEDGALHYNIDFPEITITPDSQKSPAERAILERERRRNQRDYDEVRNREWTSVKLGRSNRTWNSSAQKKALDVGNTAASGLRTAMDFVPIAGDVLQGLDAIKDATTGNYLTAGIGAGMLAVPNLLEKPLKYLGKGVKSIFELTDNQWDEAYNAAIKAGDMEEVQRLRDLHFMAKAPDTKTLEKTYRGERGTEAINSYELGNGTRNPGMSFTALEPYRAASYTENNVTDLHMKKRGLEKAIEDRRKWIEFSEKNGFLTPEDKAAALNEISQNEKELIAINEKLPNFKNPDVRELYTNLDNVEVIDAKGSMWNNVWDKISRKRTNTDRLAERVKKEGYNGLIIKNVVDDGYGAGRIPGTDVVALDTRRAKLSDAITKDDAGNIIPLSQRDNFNINDIRYGFAPWLVGAGTIGTAYGLSNQEKHGGPLVQAANKYGGLDEPTQKMQIGSEYWRQQALKPTFTEELAEFNSNRTIERTLPEIVVTPNKYTSPVYWRKSLGMQNENTKEIAKKATDLVLSNIEKDKEIVNQRNKAIIRANKNTKAPLYNSTAELQEALFKIGAFDSIKDRKGRAVTYNTAVDGIRGRMTNAAIRKAREMGYDVDISSGIVSKHTTSTPEYTGLEAIVNHKVNYNIQNPYIVVDKANNLMQIMREKDVLEKHEITSSLNKGDGWYPLLGHAGLPNMPRTTGAGIYTVKGIPTSAYPRDMDEKQPMFVLYAGNTNSTMAIHEPVNAKRRALFENNNTFDNRASYGCISPKPGIVGRLYNNKVIQTGDSVYVLPETPGNYLYEKDGKLQMHYGENNPIEFTTESGFRGKFRYNKNK